MLKQRGPAPRRLWIIGILALIWNGLGALDYVMLSVRDREYMAQYPAEAIQVIDALPVWMLLAWPLGVASALAGSALLLLRSHWAVPALALSLATLAGETIRFAVHGVPAALRTNSALFATLAVWTMAVALLGYAMAMRRNGILR